MPIMVSDRIYEANNTILETVEEIENTLDDIFAWQIDIDARSFSFRLTPIGERQPTQIGFTVSGDATTYTILKPRPYDSLMEAIITQVLQEFGLTQIGETDSTVIAREPPDEANARVSEILSGSRVRRQVLGRPLDEANEDDAPIAEAIIAAQDKFAKLILVHARIEERLERLSERL